MPGLDGTGPQGVGPMTGRGMGLCGSERQTMPMYPQWNLQSAYGGGFRGRGRGWRNRVHLQRFARWNPPTPQQELADLNALADQLKNQLDAIQKRIEELNS
jgi:predicted esterase